VPDPGPFILHNGSVIVESSWPKPDRDAQKHSERLIAHLRLQIDAADGWMSFADFMRETLYAPGLGYYSAGADKFGEAGDFITAPEISSLFGHCVAAQCAGILEHVGGDTIVEAGAGSGALAADIISEFPPKKYRIVEVSADLRARQQSRIKPEDVAADVDWLNGPEEIDAFNGVIIGNEVIDALPVERFRITANGVDAVGVVWNGAAFSSITRPAEETLIAAVREVEEQMGRSLPPGYCSEIRPQLAAFIAEWASKLQRGAMIWIDYGCSRAEYYASDRDQGTLMCHYRHRAHDDPFMYPGLQDITAWVDFSALAQAGTSAGLTLSGYATQAHFLLGCGIDQRYDAMRREAEDESRVLELNEQLRRLMMPGEMGERFRVMALTSGLDHDLIGFSFRDLSATL